MTATSQYPAAVPELRPRPPRDELLPPPAPSFGLRAFPFLIAVGIGIGGVLAWQAYGDAARQMIATAYPERLGWIAPPAPTTAPAPQIARDAESAPAPLASAAPPAPSLGEEHLKAMAADLAAMRQSVEQLAGQVAPGRRQASDEIAKLGEEHLKAMAADLAAMRQSVEKLAGQVASGQRQVSDEIAKLQATEQDILNRIPIPPPAPSAQSKPQRPAAAPARRPAPPPVPQVR